MDPVNLPHLAEPWGHGECFCLLDVWPGSNPQLLARERRNILRGDARARPSPSYTTRLRARLGWAVHVVREACGGVGTALA